MLGRLGLERAEVVGQASGQRSTHRHRHEEREPDEGGADRRLEELGFETHFNVANPAKWMATANDTLQLVNFFESINTSYEVNSKS